MRIALNMIVRNEATVIERCLASVQPYISEWCIVDTGSTDNTPELIRKALEGIPGELGQHAWVNHAHNRTMAFRRAVERCADADYIFWLDAKDVVVSWPKEIARTPFGFNAMVRYGNLEYDRPALLRPDKAFAWSQGVHEALMHDGRHVEMPQLHSLVVEPRGGQVSSHDAGKFQSQVDVLRAEYQSTNSTRAAYYLAQALRDANDQRAAYDQYLVRASMVNGWVEETWSAQLEAAKCAERLDLGFHTVLGCYLLAHQMRPTRAEALYHASRYCRLQGKHVLGLMFARDAVAIPRPADRLFVEFGIYTWLAHEEIALNAAFSGNAELARTAISKIDESLVTSDAERARVRQNKAALGCTPG